MKMAVYGSLRAGYNNHFYLSEATCHGEATLKGYDLYQAFGPIPGIVKGEGEVVVELYSDYDLESIDLLEGEGKMYKRTVVNINGEDCYTYVYMHDVAKDGRIDSGDYKDFINEFYPMIRVGG